MLCVEEPLLVTRRPPGKPPREPPSRGTPRGGPPRRREGPPDREPRDVPGVKNPYVRFRPLVKPPLEPALTTLWEYPSQHYGTREQGSSRYRGATPSWVIWQVIQRFTKEGDLVVDPFCGSGTTLDVCKDTGRQCRGFDLAPTRPDIEQADARHLPLDRGSVELAFLDPPYADNLTYSDDPRCIGRTKAQDGSYFRAMAEALDEAHRVLRPGGHLALYVQDVLHASGKGRRSFWPLGLELAELARRRFVFVDHVAVVRKNKDLARGEYKKAALEQGFLLRGFNHLLLFEKSSEKSREKGSQKGKERPPAPPGERGAAPRRRRGR